MPWESGHDYDGYIYGAPQQHGGDMGNVKPFESQRPQVQPAGDVGCLGCLGMVFMSPLVLFWGLLDWRKAQLHAETERYHADRRLESVVAQVTGRLEDTTRHLQAGIAPGATLHDMDRTSWGFAQSVQKPDPQTNITMNGYSAPANPYDVDLPPTDYNFKGDDDE